MMIEHIEWLGHASFRIQGPPLIYIDPWRVTRSPLPADAILISHDHYDHCSPADVEKLRGPNTVIVASPMAARLISGATVLRPWQSLNVGRASIRTIPAYNSHHPHEFEGVGFVISLGMYDVYYAGDTGLIPEMDNLRPDIAILPIGGQQTMNADEAAKAVQQMRPRWVIPSHWGNAVAAEGGTLIDLRAFQRSVQGLTELIVPQRAQ
jgi:L-ascorbate metabolism protein UlaG (beta-lactamase superfamily)